MNRLARSSMEWTLDGCVTEMHALPAVHGASTASIELGVAPALAERALEVIQFNLKRHAGQGANTFFLPYPVRIQMTSGDTGTILSPASAGPTVYFELRSPKHLLGHTRLFADVVRDLFALGAKPSWGNEPLWNAFAQWGETKVDRFEAIRQQMDPKGRFFHGPFAKALSAAIAKAPRPPTAKRTDLGNAGFRVAFDAVRD